MKKIMAFDLGSKTLGIAITDSLGIAAHGLENFRYRENDYQKAIEHACSVIKKERVNEIAIGLALNMTGSESKSSKASQTFKIGLLKRNPKLKISMVDERLTTVLASNRLREMNLPHKKQKKVIDMQSAVAILETYMGMKKNGKI